MRSTLIISFLLFSFLELSAQLDIRVGISQNSHYINFGKDTDYFYGGVPNTSVGPMVDLEFRFKRKSLNKKGYEFNKLAFLGHKSILLGAHLTNHVHSEYGRAFTTDIAFDDVFSDWRNQYVHIPILLKFNAQPFVLDDDFNVSFGIGITNSILLSSNLKERVILYTRDANNVIISQQELKDEANVNSYSKKYTPQLTIEMAGSFRRLYLSILAWGGFGDQYLKGLEGDWNLNSSQSIYLGSYEEWGKVTYGGGGIVLAFKIN